jgi:hypothetical protein
LAVTLSAIVFTVAQLTDYEAMHYDVLALGVRQLPERPEVTSLRDAGGAVSGLLLEFPEPVDWARASLRVTASDGSEVACTAVRSTDGARVLLLLVETSGVALEAWPSGMYTLTFAYSLDLGDGYPVLCRRGSSAQETPDPIELQID